MRAIIDHRQLKMNHEERPNILAPKQTIYMETDEDDDPLQAYFKRSSSPTQKKNQVFEPIAY
jgi:hypothetical protein